MDTNEHKYYVGVQSSAAYAEATSRKGVNRLALFPYTIGAMGVVGVGKLLN
jgi:hypothetical protein